MNSSLQRAADPVYNTVLVPLDGSQLVDGAIPTACALATRFGATVHTVPVVASDLDRQRIRGKAADALGTDSDDAHIHVEVVQRLGEREGVDDASSRFRAVRQEGHAHRPHSTSSGRRRASAA